jgi:hypothetical protein
MSMWNFVPQLQIESLRKRQTSGESQSESLERLLRWTDKGVDGEHGVPEDAPQIRCTRCQAVVPPGMKKCQFCGAVAPGAEADPFRL